MKRIKQYLMLKHPLIKSEQKDSDVRINVKNVTLHLHRFVLEQNSPTFSRMFKDNDVETSPREEFSITEHNIDDVIQYFMFFYPELRQQITDQTPFQNILDLCENYETPWIKQRISNFFLDKKECGLAIHGIKVLFYADKYQMTALKDEIIKNHASNYFRMENFLSMLQSKDFKDLSEDLKIELAIKCLFTIAFKSLPLSAENKTEYISELTDIIESLKTKKKPTERTYDLPFQNVFKKPTEHSDIEIVVSKTVSFHLHKQTLKRLSGRFKDLIENNKEANTTKLNVELKDGDLNAFLLMLRFFYPKHQFQLKAYHQIVELYAMCERFDVEWLKVLVKEQVNSMLKIGNISSILRCLQIAEEIDIVSLRSQLYSKIVNMSLIKVKGSHEYQYLGYVVRYKIMKYKFRSRSDNLEAIFGLLDDIFIQKIENLKIVEEDPHDAHGPYPQIE
ncbi:uncharacterized protein [Clytia hemisphaerica]|uniref:BTB domain-containing protein n=1 Tax=Clytia hemisphaerica TaxID=252671 RepID=A0A7M5X3V7_9CNID